MDWADYYHKLVDNSQKLKRHIEKMTNEKALNKQIGGDHYKQMAIQPAEYIHKNNLGFLEGTAIAYISRWRNKNGIEDLKKAIHTIELLIELEESLNVG